MTPIRSKLTQQCRGDATLELVAVVALLIDPGKVSSKLAHRQQHPPHRRPWPSCPAAGGGGKGAPVMVVVVMVVAVVVDVNTLNVVVAMTAM
ncbi:hypothetical protein E2C01_050554 [Portunus trituberculatus]|uniref:Uncharacterized protein n=1 Tax=Portunus trituberculatus TaxID=210409 RepID=A0A5B7GGG3_PORTR|nr:hypothetical protein [Portunus trituberculatus]